MSSLEANQSMFERDSEDDIGITSLFESKEHDELKVLKELQF